MFHSAFDKIIMQCIFIASQRLKPHHSKIIGSCPVMFVPVEILTASELKCKQLRWAITWQAVKGLILQRKGGISRTDIWRLKVFPLKCRSLGSSSNCPPWSLSSRTTSCNGRGEKNSLLLETNTNCDENSSLWKELRPSTAVGCFCHTVGSAICAPPLDFQGCHQALSALLLSLMLLRIIFFTPSVSMPTHLP